MQPDRDIGGRDGIENRQESRVVERPAAYMRADLEAPGAEADGAFNFTLCKSGIEE